MDESSLKHIDESSLKKDGSSWMTWMKVVG